MTQPKTEDLLKKINYIEADVEIQKQILFSIPSANKEQIEQTISLIAAKKEEVGELRRQLQQYDPEEFERILTLEKAVAEFKKIAAVTPFQAIINRNVHEECALSLMSGEQMDCLLKACDNAGNWTIITLDGEVRQFPAPEVAEKPPEINEP